MNTNKVKQEPSKRPIDRIIEAFENANAVLLASFKSQDKTAPDTFQYLSVNGKLFLLHEKHDERGSYNLFTEANKGILVQSDIETIQAATL